ncbi:MAG: MiaB/RimO family radical SAM methylthiotransferase [Proteobacteria bacterium]|nr:MiaB/RimO family radical SAM methylthiotransferase [Pseudomonadota bacterium]
MNIAFHFLGCRLNEAENEQLARSFVDHGHKMVTLEDSPDVIILNTCGVTCDAMRKSRNFARRMAALAPRLLVLMGCAIDLMAEGETPLSDEDLLQQSQNRTQKIIHILRKDRPNAADIILNAMDEFQSESDVDEAEKALASASYRLRMRSFIKIQDGCNNQCTYCAVRLARGKERSEPAAHVIHEIQKCLEIGEKEIVLTGVQLGAWREDNRSLKDLIRDILTQTDVQRLRLSSIEPWHIRPELWELWEDKRLCPHFHIPVQSGSNDVLTAMRRRTPIDGYLNKIRTIRSEIPNVRISTDLIVGFPGETQDMWKETLDFIREAAFDDVHLFRFSPRPNTIAAALPNPVPPAVKRERWNEAETLIQSIRQKRLQSTIGYRGRVLWEIAGNTNDNRIQWQGYSENYLLFARDFPQDKHIRGTITEEIFNQEDLNLNLQLK